MITSKLSERSIEFADQKTERGKVINREYSIDRDQATAGASPLRINVLLSCRRCLWFSGPSSRAPLSKIRAQMP